MDKHFRPLFALTLFVVLLFRTGFALKCYACLGNTESDCYKGIVQSMVAENCTDVEETHYKMQCAQFSVLSYDPPLHERACMLVRKDDDFCVYTSTSPDIDDCYSCETDLCNSLPN